MTRADSLQKKISSMQRYPGGTKDIAVKLNKHMAELALLTTFRGVLIESEAFPEISTPKLKIRKASECSGLK